MAKSDDIAATEKLLDLIRHGKGVADPAGIGTPSNAPRVRSFNLDEDETDLPTPPPDSQEEPTGDSPTVTGPATAPSLSLELEDDESTGAAVPPPTPAPAADLPATGTGGEPLPRLTLELEDEDGAGPEAGASPVPPPAGTSPTEARSLSGLRLDDPEETAGVTAIPPAGEVFHREAVPPDAPPEPAVEPTAEPTPEPTPEPPPVEADDRDLEIEEVAAPATTDTAPLPDRQLVQELGETAPAMVTPAASRQGLSLFRSRRREVLACEIHGDRLLVVRTTVQGKNHTGLEDYRLRERPKDGDDDWWWTALDEILRELAPKGSAQIWFALADTTIHQQTLPVLPDKELSTAVYWAVKKEHDFDDETVIFDYTVAGRVQVKDQVRLVCRAFLADRGLVHRLRQLCDKHRLECIGVTSCHLARQLFFGPQYSRGAPVVLLVVMDDEHTTIYVYRDGWLLFHREIKSGLVNLDEEGLVALRRGDESVATPFAFNRLDTGGLQRLLRQVQRTVDYCTTTYESPPANRILFCGPPALDPDFLRFCSKETQTVCQAITPLEGKRLPMVQLSDDDPAGLRLQVLLAGLLGLAGTDPHQAQNFLYTHRDRHADAVSRRVSQGILLAFGLVMAVVAGSQWYLGRQAAGLQAQLAPLQARARQAATRLGGADPSQILTLGIARLQERRQAVETYALRYRPVATLASVQELLPGQAKILHLAWQEEGEGNGAGLELRALFFGEGPGPEVRLAEFLRRLAEDPLMAPEPTIASRKEVTVDGRDALYVVLRWQAAVLPPAAENH